MKEVKKHLTSKNFYLTIYERIKQGIRPSIICKELNISKQCLNYYIASLKRDKLIKKVGYGTWKILKDFQERSKKKHFTGHPKHLEPLLRPDMNRGHAFIFTISIPKLKNWYKRREILSKHNIDFEKLDNIYGGAEKVSCMGRKIILTNKSVIVYEKSSYFADTSKESKSYALYELGKLIKSLEKYLGADFSFKGQYKIKISRQHHSLIKNALAKQYDKEGKKLICNWLGEQWLIIDNSFNLHEIETVHSITAVEDNKKVQDFFNGVKTFNEYTPQTVMTAIGKVTDNQVMFAENMKSHVKAVQELAKGVRGLRTEVKKMASISK